MIESPNHAIAAGLVFVIAYAFIASERIHRTIVAVAGAAAVLALRLVDQETAFGTGRGGVDWNVIFLLLGMMIIVTITRRTGIFQWMAIKAAKAAKGQPVRLVILLSAITAVLSAFLDNVTTVLFMAPVTLLIADGIGIKPLPILIAQILASNIGGTATLIGDPPNIMIGSVAKLGFLDFLVNLGPVIAIIFVVFIGCYVVLFRRQLAAPPDAEERIAGFDESRAITDRNLCVRCVAVLGLTFVGFFTHQALHLEPATIALTGAGLLLLCSGADIDEVLHEVEWTTLLFFIGLFIMVGALIETGIIGSAARLLIARAGDNPGSMALALLWISAIASGVVDNIPFVATVDPMLVELAADFAKTSVNGITPGQLQAPVMMAFWWSLALGACLGGNFTLVGASANVVVAGIAERNGHPIGFMQYLRYSVPITFITIIISTIYVWLRYL
ncbi:MAG: ArsB/NhaD family transporter [Armatimonadetes bacterium]|nr:ArsB/NhaD family transporter [Armatimonadota bacterium]